MNIKEAKRNTAVLESLLYDFRHITADLLVCEEQKEMMDDFIISMISSGMTEISYHENTLAKYAEISK